MFVITCKGKVLSGGTTQCLLEAAGEKEENQNDLREDK